MAPPAPTLREDVVLDDLVRSILRRLDRLLELLVDAVEGYLFPHSTLHLTTKEGPMSNYQLTEGDVVTVAITDTDDVTNEPVTPDAGSVTAVLSGPSTDASVVVDPSGTFATVTAGEILGTDNEVTVNATVGGVPSAPAIGTFDVVAAIVTPDATSLSVSFGTESSPASAPTDAASTFADAESNPGGGGRVS